MSSKIQPLRRNRDDWPDIGEVITDTNQLFHDHRISAIATVVVLDDHESIKIMHAYAKDTPIGSFALTGAVDILKAQIMGLLTTDDLE